MLINPRFLAATGIAGLTVLVVALLAIAPWSTTSEAGGLIEGDANCDHTIDARDALADLKEVADLEPPAPCVFLVGDVDCNGDIEVADTIDILRFSAGVHGAQPGAASDCPAIGDQISTPSPTHSPTATATATPTLTPTGSGTSSPTPVSGDCSGPGGEPTLPPAPTSPGTPGVDSYSVTPVLPASYLGDAADTAIEFALIPGRPNEGIVATQSGYIYRVALDQSFPPKLWGDLTNEVSYDPNSAPEQGLLSVAFSPNYEQDCRVYAYYTHHEPGPERLSRFTSTPEGGLGAMEPLLDIPHPDYTNHNGGHIVFGNDGYLYLSVGDGGAGGDPNNNAQNLGTDLGKILRIDVSGNAGYSIPPDNPFADGSGSNKDEIYAYGFRNPFRFTSDPITGDIWIGDVGQDTREEVDKLVKGGDFGWDCREGLIDYPNNDDPICDGNHPTFVEPRADYDHSQGEAVTGGVVYRGGSMPELYGYYLYADFYSTHLWGVNAGDGSPPVELVHTVNASVDDFTLATNGEVYLTTYSDGIYMLSK